MAFRRGLRRFVRIARTTRRLLEEMDRGNFRIRDEVTTPGCTCHFQGNSEPLTREDHKESNRPFCAAFPDLQHTLEDPAAESDKVVVRLVNRGTHQGVFTDMQPMGTEITISVTSMIRCEEGKFAEESIEGDVVGLLQQLEAEGQSPGGR